ncbi:uncharacterized protein C8A04DRAFT_12413 [Dichotomopilus funicola]|uniref:AMP-dependent synthetase/ligase domain-containing protein n=1 Tax=Dichotomopilus funicola TaxID=1934379 RepID=A0AAN6V3Q8_9PEZI|nr:hypothetical protein C8A04DRAFT_12413 [Dichotomopilus funicola]
MAETKESLSYLNGGPQFPYKSSVWSVLQSGTDVNPDRAALISVQQSPNHLARLVGRGPVQTPASRGPDELLTWSYAQLGRGGARLATVMARHHVPPQSLLLNFVPHSADWALLVWAAAVQCLGVLNQLPQMLRTTHQQEELRMCFALKPTVVAVEDEAAVQLADELRAEAADANQPTPFLGICLSRLSKPRDGWVSLLDIAEMEFTESESTVDAATVDATDSPDRIAQIYFTSGSSGTPKGVLKTVRNLTASGPIAGARIDENFVSVALGANFAAMASSLPYIAWAMAGTLSHLKACSEYSLEKLASLRLVALGGEIMSEEFLAMAHAVVPTATVIPAFGMSEVFGAVGWPKGVPLRIPTHSGVLSVGTVTPGGRVKIVDEQGTVIPRGQVGELHLGHHAVCGRYLLMGSVDEKVNRDTFYEEEGLPWIRTGDLATIDDDGWVYIVGRKKDQIRHVTGIIQPSMIEAVLSAAFPVEIQVIGLPSPIHGMVPYPIIDRFPDGVTEGDMKEHFTHKIGANYNMGAILTLKQLGLDAWPITGSGKVSKKELATIALDYMRANPDASFSSYAVC